MTKGLSKSRYTAFCQCPKNLWLKVYKPKETTEDPAIEVRFEHHPLWPYTIRIRKVHQGLHQDQPPHQSAAGALCSCCVRIYKTRNASVIIENIDEFL